MRRNSEVKREVRVEGDITYVTLACGALVQVDAADADSVSGHNWWSSGRGEYRYATTYLGAPNKRLRLHHLIMGEAPSPGMLVDHINRDTFDNRRSNLRWVTRADNKRNSRNFSSTGLRGVYVQPSYSGVERYRVQIYVGKKTVHVGSYSDLEEAILVHDKTAKALLGPCARMARGD